MLAWRPGGSAAAAGVAGRVHDGASLPEVPAWPSKLAQAVLGQRRVDLDLVVVVGSVGSGARSTRWPTKIGWMRASIACR